MKSNLKKGSKIKLSDHFNSSEFDCSCDQCGITIIDMGLVDRLEKMRLLLGSQLKINSGYRCKHKQDMLRIQGYETSVGPSQHELGNAADVSNGIATGKELSEYAEKAGFTSIGVAKTWVHVDIRPGIRHWAYKK